MARRSRSASRFGAALLALVASAGAGCWASNDGPSPPTDQLYFPAGLAISPGGSALYVANSDFDLQYTGGSVAAYDLSRVRSIVRAMWGSEWSGAKGDPCGAQSGLAAPVGANLNLLLYPGICAAIDPIAPADGKGSLVSATARIGAFAADAMYVANASASGARLFIPVRGEPSLTYFDVDDDRAGPVTGKLRLDCGQGADGERCDPLHRLGIDATDNTRQLTMPAEPYGLAASAGPDLPARCRAGYRADQSIAVTHQTTGQVSLFTDRVGGADAIFGTRPTLQFVLSGLSFGVLGIAPLPVPQIACELGYDPNYQPGLVVTFRSSPEIDLLRFVSDAYSSPSRPYLVRADATAIRIDASGIDSRGVAVDATRRTACEEGCGPDGAARLACLTDCAATPLDVYVANRTPPALLVGRTRATVSAVQGNFVGLDDSVVFHDSVPLSYGASRVVLGSVTGIDGKLHPRVFIACFDARYVFVYDPEAGRIEGVVRTGRGPHALVVDPVAPFAYLGHFTDSYLGVVDLDQRHADTYLTVVAMVGIPTAPRETK